MLFLHLNHETLGSANIEIIIKTLHDKCLVNIRGNGLFIGNRSVFLAI